MLTASDTDDKEKKTVFVEFNEDIYNLIVDDTTHLVQGHSNDVQQLSNEWSQKYGAPKCTVSDCAKSTRHYGRGRRERLEAKVKMNEDDDDGFYPFYESIYDRKLVEAVGADRKRL